MDALIVAGTENRRHVLTDVLNRERISCVVCSTAAEARRVSLSRQFDIFVIYSGLSDEHGNELAMFLSRTHDCGGVYLDDDMHIERLRDELNTFGIVTLITPTTKTALLDAIRMLAVTNIRVRELKAANQKLMQKLEDMKIINRAKLILMRLQGYSEERAHKYIESRAMEQRSTRRKVAQDIINTYEDE